MEKIKKILDTLCRIPGDKYVHLLACLLLTFIIGMGVSLFSDESQAVCAGIGACAAMIVGFFKEWYDNFTDGEFGYFDLVADAVGCALSAALLCLWTWCLGV